MRDESGWSEIRTLWSYGKTSSKPSCTHICRGQSTQFLGCSFFPSSWGNYPCTQCWRHVPLPAEPPCWPFINFCFLFFFVFETRYHLYSFSCPALLLSVFSFFLLLFSFFSFCILPACMPVPEEGIGSPDIGSVMWALGIEPVFSENSNHILFVLRQGLTM